MRNKYPGKCYYCTKEVEVGAGHFERYMGTWRTIHASCVFELRAFKETFKIAKEIAEKQLQPFR